MPCSHVFSAAHDGMKLSTSPIHYLLSDMEAPANRTARKSSKSTFEGDQRKKGRPKKNAAAVGPDQFIEAARDLLRSQHPHKLTRANVARAAKADPKLLQYYFGTLEQLLIEVAHRYVVDLSDRMAEAGDIDGSTEEKMSRRLHALLQFYVEAPNFWPLVMDKIYLSDDERARDVRRDFNNTSFQRLANIIQVGFEKREIASGVDARLLYVALIGLCEIFVTGKPIVDVLFSQYEQERLVGSYGDFIVQLVMKGLSPR
jgi:TetR/AcrR family transcriptional regulator